MGLNPHLYSINPITQMLKPEIFGIRHRINGDFQHAASENYNLLEKL